MKLFGASQSIAASIQIFNGVGHRLDSLGTSQIRAYEKVMHVFFPQRRLLLSLNLRSTSTDAYT